MRKGKNTNSIDTFLGADACIEGVIDFEGAIRLDGNVKGKIFSSGGTVIIGERAVVNAEINVDVAIIMGEVNGTIDARDRIEIYAPGRVVGDIRTPKMSIESGVIIDGTCAMRKGSEKTKKKTNFISKMSLLDETKGKQ
ncbi:MAG: polymer-forming cytoskeletal protein [Desulfobacterales bacterium]|nr:polymer-forming cytoskeletal protein [Desulfobacterales bacterium]